MNEIVCRYTNEIVCPYCGYKFHDSWDYGSQDECFEVDCGECEKTFDVYRDISVTYCSTVRK